MQRERRRRRRKRKERGGAGAERKREVEQEEEERMAPQVNARRISKAIDKHSVFVVALLLMRVATGRVTGASEKGRPGR